MALNVFEDFAESNKPAHEKRRERIATKRRMTLKQKQVEKGQLDKLYRIERTKRIEALLEGPDGEAFRALLKMLDNLPGMRGPTLVAFVRDWKRGVRLAARLEALFLINMAGVKLRTARGLPPFDDGFGPAFGDKETAFDEVKRELEDDSDQHEGSASELR